MLRNERNSVRKSVFEKSYSNEVREKTTARVRVAGSARGDEIPLW